MGKTAVYVRDSDGKEIVMSARLTPKLMKSAGIRRKATQPETKIPAIPTGSKQPAAPEPPSKEEQANTRETVEQIRNATTADQINEIIEGETRKTVLDFAKKKIESLNK